MLYSFKNGRENGYKKWQFQHRDGHTTQKVKKIVVSKTHLVKKNCPYLSKSNFDVKIEENCTLENCY